MDNYYNSVNLTSLLYKEKHTQLEHFDQIENKILIVKKTEKYGY